MYEAFNPLLYVEFLLRKSLFLLQKVKYNLFNSEITLSREKETDNG